MIRPYTVLYKLVKPVTDQNKDSVSDVVTLEIRVPVQRLVLTPSGGAVELSTEICYYSKNLQKRTFKF